MGNKKIPGLRRIHVLLDPETVAGLDWLADDMIRGNRSRAVREAVAEAVTRKVKEGSRRKSAVR